MKRAQGFAPIRQFAHKPKVRRNAQRIANLQSSQALEMTSWGHVHNVKHRVNTERVNWRGLWYYLDPAQVDRTPRLRRG